MFFAHRSLPLICFKRAGLLKRQSDVGHSRQRCVLWVGEVVSYQLLCDHEDAVSSTVVGVGGGQTMYFILKEARSHRVNVELAQSERVIHPREGPYSRTWNLTIQQSGEMTPGCHAVDYSNRN